MPRTLVNLVLILNFSYVQDLNVGLVCTLLHKRSCPCAAAPTPEQAKTLNDYIVRYQQVLIDLVNSGRYYGRDDFTVVIQPFFSKTLLPRKKDNKPDLSYFSPDCFHFSGKGHQTAALSLWNNMIEPVGAKQTFWHVGEELKCPTDEHPYIFTHKNSAEALEEYKQRATMTPTTNPTSSGAHSSVPPSVSSTEKHKHRKHHKSDSDVFNKIHVAIYAAFFLLMMILLIVCITRRQQIRLFVHGLGRRHINGFTNPQYPDDDDAEAWNRSHPKSGLPINM